MTGGRPFPLPDLHLRTPGARVVNDQARGTKAELSMIDSSLTRNRPSVEWFQGPDQFYAYFMLSTFCAISSNVGDSRPFAEIKICHGSPTCLCEVALLLLCGKSRRIF
jgi:hypothetical protein